MKNFLKFAIVFIFIFVFAHSARADITTGLVGWWKLDGNATDSSGNGSNGTLVGGPTFTNGQIDQAINLNGTSQYVNVGAPATLNNLPALSISAWIKPDSLANPGNDIIAKQNGEHPMSTGWVFRTENESANRNSLQFEVNYDISITPWNPWQDMQTIAEENVIEVGEWNCAVVTWDGSNIAANAKFYVNGILVNKYLNGQWDRDGVGSRTDDSYRPLIIGDDAQSYGVQPFDGLMDDVRIYNRVLSVAEIQAICSNSFGNIIVNATLDGQPWPSSGTGAINYSLSGPSGDISNSSIPLTYENVIADENYTLTYFSGGPTGAILNPISPVSPTSSQFLPSDTSISFNLNFISGSNLCPLTPQSGRTIISFEPYQVIGSPAYATHKTGPYSLGTPLAIGKYDVTLVSYDSHTGPGGSGYQNQPNEKYYLKLLNQSNNLITSTNSTTDIPNDQDFVTTLVNTNLQIPSSLYSVNTWHSAYIDNSDYNSLYPICAAFDESFDYSLSNSGTSNVTKTNGDAFTQNTITKTLAAGTTQNISLSVSGAPPGVTTNISGQDCDLTCTSVITFTVSPSTSVGTYPITITGSPLNKQTIFNLIVSGDPLIVSCSASPMLVFLGETVTLTANVSGGTPPYIYSWNGTGIPTNPSPDTNPFGISYNTVGQKSVSVTVTDSSSPPFQIACPVITVRANIDPQYKEF